ncbi:winged helix-turn-helix transcriptional regulator [Streptomyces sp. NPDC048111]|uniref:winged helix-turn-helix transcriptional regulator n=1 Tax=Streptomyces sp. NPDC048111 TaxID=3365500 RepID=UPI00371006D5
MVEHRSLRRRHQDLRVAMACSTRARIFAWDRFTATLRALGRDGMVSGRVCPTVPPRVEYEPTPLGHEAGKLTILNGEWARVHVDQIHNARTDFDHQAAVAPAPLTSPKAPAFRSSGGARQMGAGLSVPGAAQRAGQLLEVPLRCSAPHLQSRQPVPHHGPGGRLRHDHCRCGRGGARDVSLRSAGTGAGRRRTGHLPWVADVHGGPSLALRTGQRGQNLCELPPPHSARLRSMTRPRGTTPPQPAEAACLTPGTYRLAGSLLSWGRPVPSGEGGRRPLSGAACS